MTKTHQNPTIALMLACITMLLLAGCNSGIPVKEPILNPIVPIEADSPNQDGSYEPKANIKTRAGDLTLSYADGKSTLIGVLQRSTPCVNWQIQSRVMESFPEQVVFEITDESTAQMCIQVLGEPQEVSSSVEVSAQASFRVLFEGEEVFSGQLS